MHLAGTTRQRVHAETAGVAERIEHFFAANIPLQQFPVFALIQKKTGFLPVFKIHFEFQSVFQNHLRFGKAAIGQESVCQFHGLTEARIMLVFQVNRLYANLLQTAYQVRQDFFGTLDHQLHHRQIAVQVGDYAGQEIAFGVQQAAGICLARKHVLLPDFVRHPDFAVPIIGLSKIKRLVGELKHPAHNLALGRKEAVAQPFVLIVKHLHNITVLCVGQLFHAARENPRVAVDNRTVASGFEGEVWIHGRKHTTSFWKGGFGLSKRYCFQSTVHGR